MVCTAIDAVHNDVASVIELISQPLECDAPHDRGGHPGRIDDRVLALLPCKGALHRANDVTTFAHRTQCRLGFSIEMPPALSRLLRKAHVGESIKAADEKRVAFVPKRQLRPIQGQPLRATGIASQRPAFLSTRRIVNSLDIEQAQRARK